MTFNYSDLPEQAVERIFGHHIAAFAHYLSQDLFRLYKPHGAITWAYKVLWHATVSTCGRMTSGQTVTATPTPTPTPTPARRAYPHSGGSPPIRTERSNIRSLRFALCREPAISAYECSRAHAAMAERWTS
jgi:hypothetical protein